jgi:hypothetical protein
MSSKPLAGGSLNSVTDHLTTQKGVRIDETIGVLTSQTPIGLQVCLDQPTLEPSALFSVLLPLELTVTLEPDSLHSSQSLQITFTGFL